jgi:hypothetical protein
VRTWGRLEIRGFVIFAIQKPVVGNCDFIGSREYVQNANFKPYIAI